ncbi:hypothetical protein bcgnr5378_37640 [Bacillus cereus]|uniref:Uncharacterized protein n=1 Tax=Bacillus cereus TaxID=1396 RepID=A0A164QMH0_BACCE|nr:hypothetical protein [Bacillus cereus]KZD71906.1 hypothetical protein B4088_0367 [Bacillus cereus]HDR8320416.1 hypothetical protein [Bacillus cereus]HDR8329414.1 hypothetical protein [Bacillus cereus]HDR8335982.1 hypothetical protein [Bacillus cereus]
MSEAITIKILEEHITTAERWEKDAEERLDWNEVSHYQGKIEAYKELIKLLS